MPEHLLAALGTFVPLLLGAVGFPFPEEAVLPAGGIAAHPSSSRLFAVILGGYLGVLAADNLLFAAGRFLGPRLLAHPRTGALLSVERRSRIEGFLERRGAWTLVGLRFLPGVRTGAYLSLGMLGYSWRTFLIVDGLMAVLTVCALTSAGFLLGPQWEQLVALLPPAWVLILAAALPLTIWLVLRRRGQARSNDRSAS